MVLSNEDDTAEDSEYVVVVEEQPPYTVFLSSNLEKTWINENYIDELMAAASAPPVASSYINLAASTLSCSQYGGQSYVMVTKTEMLPPKARLLEDCTLADNTGLLTLHSSYHLTYLGFFQRKKQKQPMAIVLKESQGKLAQLEAWFCACHRLLTPDCVPKARVVYKEGQAIGLYSELLRDFTAIGDEKITAELLNEHAVSLARIIIAAFLLEEDDLHRFNFSLKYRIDFDGLFWSLMHFYKGKRFWTAPEKAFDINKDDIETLPCLRHAEPYYWPTKNHGYNFKNDFSADECKHFATLEKNQKFVEAKYKLLLKFMVLKPVQFVALAALFLDPVDFYQDPIVKLMETRLTTKQTQLKHALTNMPDFKKWLEKDGDSAFAEIQVENQGYNQSYKNEKYKDQRIDLIQSSAMYDEFRSSILSEPQCVMNCA